LFGENNVYLYSSRSEKKNTSFEEKIKVSYAEPHNGIVGKINYVLHVIKAIYALKPDLIVINHINIAPLGMIIKKLFGIKYVLNVYGLEIWSGMNGIKAMALRSADMIIGDCNHIIKYIIDRHDIDHHKAHLLYDPVDVDVFRPAGKDTEVAAKHNLPIDKFILMTLGRLDRYKGHAMVIRALKELPDDIIYAIVGGGRLEEELKNLVKKNGLLDRVCFTGRVQEKELVNILNICDIFILISKFDKYEGEGLPLTPIEAAACSKPIIVGNEDGSVEACDDGINGYLVARDDVKTMVDKIMTLYENSDLKKKMGMNSRAKVVDCFSDVKFKQTLREIIKK